MKWEGPKMVRKRFKYTENLVCRVSGLDEYDAKTIQGIRGHLSQLIHGELNVQEFSINFYFPQDLLAEEKNPSCEIWWLGFVANQKTKLKTAIEKYFSDNWKSDAVVNIVDT